MSEPTCIFCKVIAGDIPSESVYSDDLVVAFKDIRPVAPVHVLIVPRKHIPTLNDMQAEDSVLLDRLFEVARKLARQFGVHQSGYRTVFNVNAEAGQTVYHLHLHVIGGRSLSWP